MPRQEFREATKRLLAERVGYRCSNPTCRVATVGPSDASTGKQYVGVAAHIYSASIETGPRPNPSLTEEERRSPDNGIHLCRKCATIVDNNNGADYPANVLFSWKRSAEAAAKKNIHRTHPDNLFSKVDFANLEKDYSTALTCTGLTEKNILSCPSDRGLVRDVMNKLRLASKCILLGSSGTGKSLVTYQVAYKFHLEKWNVFKINKQTVTNSAILASPAAKSVILIDDAQTIEAQYLDSLLRETHKDRIVLANWNTSTIGEDPITRKFPTVEIVPSLQVKMLEAFCIKNKHKIAQTLRSIGLRVHNNIPPSSIDFRIARAAREKTPWLFNYNLTEGWHGAKTDYDLLKHDQGLHVVLATIAVFQLATLDMGVGENVVMDALCNYNDDSDWLRRAKKVIRVRCLIHEEKIRNKHYEYSREILRAFVVQEGAKDDHNYLTALIKEILNGEEYVRGHSNIIEFIMFDYERCSYKLRSEGFLQRLVEDIIQDEQSPTPAKVRKLNSLIRITPDATSALRLKDNFVENWVLNSSKENAYQLADFLNTLYNEKYGSLDLGVPMCDHLVASIGSAEVEDRPRFARLLNRLHGLLRMEDRDYASTKIGQLSLSDKLYGVRATMDCYHFSSVINDLVGINLDWADKQVAASVPTIANIFNNDFTNALDFFSQLLNYYFQVVCCFLGNYRPRPMLNRCGRELAGRLDESEIVNGFSNVSSIQLQTYSYVLVFLSLHNKAKLMVISEKFDYARLESLTSSLPIVDRNHKSIVNILRNPDSLNWSRHVSHIVGSVDYVEWRFIQWAEDLAMQRVREGTKYRMHIHMCEDCAIELLVLKHFHKEEESRLFERVITENMDVLTKAVCSQSLNSDDHRSKFDLLVFLLCTCEFAIEQLFSEETTCDKVTDKLERLLRGKKWEKRIGRLYAILINKYAPARNDKFSDIERRFSSVRNTTLEDLVQFSR